MKQRVFTICQCHMRLLSNTWYMYPGHVTGWKNHVITLTSISGHYWCLGLSKNLWKLPSISHVIINGCFLSACVRRSITNRDEHLYTRQSSDKESHFDQSKLGLILCLITLFRRQRPLNWLQYHTYVFNYSAKLNHSTFLFQTCQF